MDSFYDKVSPVTQEVFIFNDTIKNNITLYNQSLEGDLARAIENSGLTKTIDKLPEGTATVIGEYGQNLSGGEKQRISIARCLIKDSDLIIMDEATSSLDQKIARDIEKLLLSLDATLLVITHRMDDEILRGYDKIYRMGEGLILDQGRWDQISNL